MTARLSALTLALLAAPSLARAEATWPNTPVARWQVQALVATLDAEILGARSATFALEAWCAAHHLAEPARITAELVAGHERPADAEQRRRLQVSDGEPVKHRYVRLRCGDKVLSEADNWYVPSRLTAEMNRLLETTDTPFGRAVAPLKPYRMTFEARAPWAPPRAETATIDIPPTLFEHRALLYTADHLPFSEVDEVYQRAVLDFPPEP